MLVSAFIRAQIDSLESGRDDKDEGEDEDGDDNEESQTQNETDLEGNSQEPEIEDILNTQKKKKSVGCQLPPDDKFHLGAMQPGCTITQLAAKNAHDIAFKDFKRNLTEYINQTFNAQGIPFPDNKYIRLSPDEIVSF